MPADRGANIIGIFTEYTRKYKTCSEAFAESVSQSSRFLRTWQAHVQVCIKYKLRERMLPLCVRFFSPSNLEAIHVIMFMNLDYLVLFS